MRYHLSAFHLLLLLFAQIWDLTENPVGLLTRWQALVSLSESITDIILKAVHKIHTT